MPFNSLFMYDHINFIYLAKSFSVCEKTYKKVYGNRYILFPMQKILEHVDEKLYLPMHCKVKLVSTIDAKLNIIISNYN